MNKKSCDYFYRVSLLGSKKAGKTSFLNRIANDSFDESYVATIGIDFKLIMLNI
jgi:GTPase SAR1 family protein